MLLILSINLNQKGYGLCRILFDAGRRQSLMHGERFAPRQFVYILVHGVAAGQNVHRA